MNRDAGRTRGFTLVELIVVIVVIGILATITALGFTRYQQETRDTRRASSASVIAESLEKYYDANGEYPSCKAVTGAPDTVSSNALNGIDATVLSAPTADSGVNSITCGAITTSSPDSFGYVGDGSVTCTDPATGVSCINFEIQYKDELNNTIASIKSRRNTDIDTSGQLTLAGNSPAYTTVQLSWNSLPNAGTYLVTQSNDLGFTTGVQTYTASTNSYLVNSLTPDTEYYFKVQASATGGLGEASNTIAVTTIHLGKPVLSLSALSSSSILASWPAAGNSNASTTYTVQRATSNDFTAGLVTFANLTTTSHTSTGLSLGVTYYYRVQAIAPTDTSAMSDIKSASTAPNQPTGVVATTDSSTQISVNWNATSGATSYTLEYSLSSDFSSPTSITGIATTSRAVTGLAQGSTFFFRVYAISGGTPSAASSSDSATTTIDAPASYSVSGSNNSTTLYGTSNAICPAGTSAYYYWYANGSGWTQGTSAYKSVGYGVSPGQTITLTVNTRCTKGSVVSSYRAGNNGVSYSRPGMNVTMSQGADGCSYGFCGRVINSSWNNICGSSVSIYATQLSHAETFTPRTTSSDDSRWKGASGSGVYTQYTVYLSCASATKGINVQSAYKCTGCS